MPPKILKPIPRTTDLQKGPESSRNRAKGKARAALKEVHQLLKAAEKLPGAVNVERYAETRALEIGALQNAVKVAASQSNSRAFQSMPRHLRRRAASHNPRRVPKKVRSKASAEIDPGDRTVQLHRKKAKLRARGNLRGQSRTEQLRARQHDKRWLGTHIFHSKRFHMVNLWGYRLPLTPTLKSFRASYRAARRKAVLQDTSYMGIMEVSGSRNDIMAALSKVCATPFAGNKYESGARAANVHVYQPECFPHNYIGPAEVVWQGDADRAWLRVHPSIFEQVLSALNSCGQGLRIRDLRGLLESFEITGPLAGRMIRRVLRVTRECDKKDVFDAMFGAEPAQCPSDTIIGVTVYDPRLSFPSARISDSAERSFEFIPPSAETASTSLWDCADGKHGPRFKKSDLDARRQQSGVPGIRLTPLTQDDRIPVMILKRTTESRAPDHDSAAFHGYTLIFPSGWSMAFLPSFIHCGAKLSGLVESRVRCREAGVPSFPEHYGAICAAGKEWEDQTAANEERRWLRKPPGKRPEFSTLGVRWPFKPDWSALSDVHVNYDKCLVKGISEEERINRPTPWLFNPIFAPYIEKIRDTLETPADALLLAVNQFRRARRLPLLTDGKELLSTALVHVEVVVLGRGSPSDMAMLYPLTDEQRCEALLQLESPAADQSPLTPSAPVMGFVSTGNMSLTRGRGHGLATIKLQTYMEILMQAGSFDGRVICAVRNRDGILYRLAEVFLVQ